MGDTVSQSRLAGGSLVPLLSMATMPNPASWMASIRSESTCRVGSPPVSTTMGLTSDSWQRAVIRLVISLAVMLSNLEKSVSQNGHFRLQPLNLTNTAARPVLWPSPCSE